MIPTTTLPRGTNTIESSGVVQPLTVASNEPQTANEAVNDGTGGRNAFGIDRLTVKTVTLPQLAVERFSGFVPGTNLSIEVIGARTAGQFVVTPGGTGETLAIASAISESSKRLETDFARIESSESSDVSPTAVLDALRTPLTTETLMNRIFADSELSQPTRLTDLAIPAKGKWLNVKALASGYVPGSVVYLAITSEPIVFAEARVDKNGVARLEGGFPVEVAGVGGHRIRVVGIRQVYGVALDDAGSVQLSDEALATISEFDSQTSATVRISGPNIWGGFHSAVRIVPLRSPLPWWTLLLLGWTVLLVLIAGLGRKLAGSRERIVATLVTILAAVPAQYLGWRDIEYVINFWGLVLLIVGLATCWLVPRLRGDKKVEESSQP